MLKKHIFRQRRAFCALAPRAEAELVHEARCRSVPCAAELSYGHSEGRVESEAEFINGVMTRKATVKSLTLSEHTIAVVGTNAIARHRWTSGSELDGKATTTKIGVLQVRLKQGGSWRLLARQAFRPPRPA